PIVRYFSELSVVKEAVPHNAKRLSAGPPGKSPHVFAVVVFRKTIDRAMLEIVARKTGKLPVLLSPDGRHRQQLDGPSVIPPEIHEQARANLAAAAAVPLQR